VVELQFGAARRNAMPILQATPDLAMHYEIDDFTDPCGAFAIGPVLRSRRDAADPD
jgi:hypothetical protein